MTFFDDPGRDVERSCTSKTAYASEGQAHAAALMYGLNLRAYECRHCNAWHLTRRQV